MTSHLVVSTECPLCGAPLDFTEGSNAVRCLHCRSNLLVTGRKQVLSYYVAPKMDARGALAKLNTAQKQSRGKWRIIKSQLYFIPYYRLTGHDFRWEVASEKHNNEQTVHPLLSIAASNDAWESESGSPDFSSLLQPASNLLGKVFGGASAVSQKTKDHPAQILALNENPELNTQSTHRVKSPKSPWGVTAGSLGRNKDFQLRNRYVEKNFIGCTLDGVGLYSLGIRPAVLRLELFRREVLQSLGKIVQPTISPKVALSVGMKTVDSHSLAYRKVMGRILSVIYFPFWVMGLKHNGKTLLAIIDAVSQSVITLDANPSLYRDLDQQLESDPQVIGFRPLTCPNCGWDLPIIPDNVIFFCSSCEKSWQILGNCLYEVSYQIAEVTNPKKQKRVRYLPFWVLETERDENRPFRFFIPAFHYRRLRCLSDLAARISRAQPSYSVLTEKLPEVHGCYYDQEDAVMMAQFSQVGLAPRPLETIKALQEDNFSMTGATLTWFPYEIKGDYLIDPFTGHRLSQNLLL